MGNIDEVWKDFSPNSRIYDLNLIDKDYNNLTDHQKYVGEVFSKYDFISIDEVGILTTLTTKETEVLFWLGII